MKTRPALLEAETNYYESKAKAKITKLCGLKNLTSLA